MEPERVSRRDRQILERQQTALAAMSNDDEGGRRWRDRVTTWADAVRRAEGRPALDDWWATKTEPELHERARALGLLD